MKYDSFDNLISYVQPGGADDEKYTLTYGSTDAEKKQHLLRTSTTPMGIKQNFEYDAKGNQIGAATVDDLTSPTVLIKTKTEYSEDGNYPVKSYDARGNAVTKEMNADGTLKSVTDPEGQKVEYGYDDSKRVELVKTTASVNGVEKVYKNEYTYKDDRLETVKHNTTDNNSCDVVYTFGYDELGRKTTVKVGEKVLSTNVYSNDRNGILKEVQYGNGGKVAYEHDDFDRITGVKYDSETNPRYTYEYGANGQAAFMKDNNLGRTHQTEYDLAERPVQATIREADTEELIYRTTLTYDEKNRLETFAESLPEESHKTSYTYDKDNRTTEIQYDDATHKVGYTYDALGRVTERNVTNGDGVYTSGYAFEDGDVTLYGTGATTPLVKKITQNGMEFEYVYDERGNIQSETRNGVTTTYEYDALGQLVRVNDPNDTTAGSAGTTWMYTYDLGGNMTKRTQYAYTADALGSPVDTRSYSYDTLWKDQLISNGSYPLTYDVIGNLKTYGGWEYEWKAGRQLVKQTQNDKIVSYDYDCNGMRIRQTFSDKTGGAIFATYNYTYSGDKLVHLTVYNDILHFFYDNQGRPANVMYNGVMYTYLHNLQGDIVGIVDSSGSLVVEYKYNAWGTILSKSGSMASTLGHRNPFRYRGYIYDEETWMYWIKSRYYYPELHRFINADVRLGKVCSLVSHNTYAYVKNRPIMRLDQDGQKDIVYSSHDNHVVENDNFIHNFIYGTNYYVEMGGTRYRANSAETVTLYPWTTLDTEFMDVEFDKMIEDAAPYSSTISVLKESVGGELDFKLKLSEKKLYLMNDIVYNRNEAGNFIWSYYLKVCNYLEMFSGALAQGGSIIPNSPKSPRFDEAHDRAARYAGLKFWYQRKNKLWLFRLKYGSLDRP